MERIVLFDGECNFCNGSVQFIIKRDPAGRYKFASIQSEAGARLLKRHGAEGTDSFVLIEGSKAYVKSTAALRLCKGLAGGWKLLVVLLAVPRPIRDAVYDKFAGSRYKWFGKADSCMLPAPHIRERFLT
jgi:Uncharacterized protein conserved in bacteria